MSECEHDWRLIDKGQYTKSDAGFTNTTFHYWWTYYCSKCRERVTDREQKAARL